MAKFVKTKRITDHDFPPTFTWVENKKWSTVQQQFDEGPYRWKFQVNSLQHGDLKIIPGLS